MDNERRFDRDEISKILKIAAELEHSEQSGSEVGLNQQELEEVAREVGIDPKYIKSAVSMLEQKNYEREGSSLLGVPTSHYIRTSAHGELTPELWEEVVAEIRRVNGGIGKTGKLGDTYEWEQRKREVGYLQLSLSPKEEHTQVTLNSSYRYYGMMVMMFSAIFGVVIPMVLAEELYNDTFYQWVFGLIGGLISVTGARFYVSYWMKKKRRMFNRLLDNVKSIIQRNTSGKSKSASTEVEIDAFEADSQQDSTTARQRKRQKN